VTFDFDKSDLKPAARAELDRAAKVMAENPDVVLELQGNTDSVGSDKYNMALGRRRAEAVFNYLNSKGIKSNRLKEVSFGEGKPAATNETDAGRALTVGWIWSSSNRFKSPIHSPIIKGCLEVRPIQNSAARGENCPAGFSFFNSHRRDAACYTSVHGQKCNITLPLCSFGRLIE